MVLNSFSALHALSPEFRAAVLARAVERRQYLHARPQVAYQETEASRMVQDVLGGLGLDFKVIPTVNPKTGETVRTGVIVDIEGLASPQDRMVLTRGDMDALPNTHEKTGLPYASLNVGEMHACGHDGHTVMQLALAEALAANRDKFRGTVRLLFQPAEEGAGGAKAMIAGGALEGLPADTPLIGYHNAPQLPLGVVATNPGPIMASADYIESLVIKGRSGHVGLNFLNPLDGARQVLNLFEEIKAKVNKDSREISLEITQMEVSPGSIATVPTQAELRGSLRSFDPALRLEIKKKIEDLCENLRGQGYGINLNYRLGTGPTINDPEAAAFMSGVAAEIFGAQNVRADYEKLFTAEDMGAYGMPHPEIPGFKGFPIVFIWTGQGTGDPDSPHDQTLHKDTYNFNDDIIGPVLDLSWAAVQRALPVEGPSAYAPFREP